MDADNLDSVSESIDEDIENPKYVARLVGEFWIALQKEGVRDFETRNKLTEIYLAGLMDITNAYR